MLNNSVSNDSNLSKLGSVQHCHTSDHETKKTFVKRRKTDFMLCTKFLLLRNFVPQKECFENIKVNSLFTSQS